jgi:hypothetical protein
MPPKTSAISTNNPYFVTITLAPDPQLGLSATTLVFDATNWNVPQQVSVTALDNGVVVRLPEQGVDRALSALVDLEQSGKVIEKDVLAIDMRLPDRVAFRLAADSAAARAEALAKKAPKKGEHA